MDISLCNGKDCSKRETCHRYVTLQYVTGGPWQSYINAASCIESDYSAYWEVNQPNLSIGKFRVCSVYVGGD